MVGVTVCGGVGVCDMQGCVVRVQGSSVIQYMTVSWWWCGKHVCQVCGNKGYVCQNMGVGIKVFTM